MLQLLSMFTSMGDANADARLIRSRTELEGGSPEFPVVVSFHARSEFIDLQI